MNRYLQELDRRFLNEGYSSKTDEKSDTLQVDYNGMNLCIIYGSGQIRFRPENVQPDERRAALSAVENLSSCVKEYVNAYEKAPAFSAQDLQSGYRLITEHNGIVLAAKDMQAHGFEFVTWLRSYDGEAVGNGNYFTDYEAAKTDFAIRSGLIDKNRYFSDEQLENIYRSLSFTKDINDCLTFDYEQQVNLLMHQIENVLPYVKDATPHLDSEPEQSM